MFGVLNVGRHVFHTLRTRTHVMRPSVSSASQQVMTQQDANEEMLKKIKARQPLGEDEASERLSKLTGDDLKRLEIIKLEYEVARASGQFTPEVVTNAIWWDLYSAHSDHQRKKLLTYHAKTESHRRKKQLKKERHQAKLLETPPKPTRTENGFTYTLESDMNTKNTIFLRIQKSTMDKHYYNNIYKSFQFGSKIVFDMSYDRYMRSYDITNTIDQMLEVHGFNKQSVDPFHIYFCNLREDSESYQRFLKSTTHHHGDYTAHKSLKDYPFTITDQSYLDLFPKDKLVYLTPQAPKMLETYNPEDIYIIGGLVDKVVTKPVSFAKAKREGIRMAKFPFDLYMKWMMGNKSITLDQTVKILQTVKNTGSWRKAFEHVPARKRQFYDEM